MKYLVTYHGGSTPTDPAAAARMREAFMSWAATVGAALVDPGAPLTRSKSVSAGGVSDGQLAAAVGGYSILEASDLDAAVRLVREHPFVARGGTLQVSEAAAL
jgi:hypothetical protein